VLPACDGPLGPLAIRLQPVLGTNLMGAHMRKAFLLGLTTFAAVMLGGGAQAADMPVKARPAPAPAPVMYNWTGFYKQ
jgi:hypothetical protein